MKCGKQKYEILKREQETIKMVKKLMKWIILGALAGIGLACAVAWIFPSWYAAREDPLWIPAVLAFFGGIGGFGTKVLLLLGEKR